MYSVLNSGHIFLNIDLNVIYQGTVREGKSENYCDVQLICYEFNYLNF
jgi:hypothetical protein